MSQQLYKVTGIIRDKERTEFITAGSHFAACCKFKKLHFNANDVHASKKGLNINHYGKDSGVVIGVRNNCLIDKDCLIYKKANCEKNQNRH